jgi:hypothetical protein
VTQRIDLICETTVSSILLSLGGRLDAIRSHPDFLKAPGQYIRGEASNESAPSQLLAWYLLRNSVLVATLLSILQSLSQEAYSQSGMCWRLKAFCHFPELEEVVPMLGACSEELLDALGTCCLGIYTSRVSHHKSNCSESMAESRQNRMM